jgi:hypothetical protein
MMPSYVHLLSPSAFDGNTINSLHLNNLLNTYPERGLRTGFSSIFPFQGGMISYLSINSQQIGIPSLIGFDYG